MGHSIRKLLPKATPYLKLYTFAKPIIFGGISFQALDSLDPYKKVYTSKHRTPSKVLKNL